MGLMIRFLGGDGPDDWNQWSSAALLLPYIEQSTLANAINFYAGLQNWSLPYNTTTHRTQVSTLLCPSDVDRLTNVDAHSNYAGNAGSAPTAFYDWNNDGTFNGLFTWSGNPLKTGSYVKTRTVVGIRDILDGTSNTAAFSEKVKGTGTWTTARVEDSMRPPSVYALITKPSVVANRLNPQAVYDDCKALNPSNPSTPQNQNQLYPNGALWYNGCPSNTRYNHVMPPNTWSCAYGGRWGDMGGAVTATSRHAGVVNVTFADGSVKAVKGTINPATWWALGTRAGGEVISSDAY